MPSKLRNACPVRNPQSTIRNRTFVCPISSLSMVEKASSPRHAASCNDWDCMTCRLSDWRKNTKRFIAPAGRCPCNCLSIRVLCACFSAFAKKYIASCSGIDASPSRSKMSILQMKVRALIFVFAVVPIVNAQAQETTATPAASPTSSQEAIIPTFETQKLARTYILDVPAPRGQITDRNGVPLAQNRLSYNLAINFHTPLDFSDAQALSFVRENVDKAGKLIGRTLRISDEAIL